MHDFFAAIEKGEMDLARQLLADDPTLAHAQSNGISAVVVAAYRDAEELLTELLAVRRSAGAPALDVHEAAVVGDAERLRAVVAADPSAVDAPAADGFHPLGLAAYFAHPACVEVLLDAGADPGRPAGNAMRTTPLHSVLAHRRDAERVHAIVEQLVAAGAPLHAPQAGGYTPLHQAAARGDAALVERLLAAGADPTSESDAGQTAAELAAERGHEAIAASLRAAG